MIQSSYYVTLNTSTETFRSLLSNWGYILLLLTYGMNVGVFYAISTLLNSLITRHFDYEVKLMEDLLSTMAGECI